MPSGAAAVPPAFPRKSGTAGDVLERSAQLFFSRNRLDFRAYSEKGNMEPKRAKVLTPAKFRHLLRVTEATSRFPERDTLILLLGVNCGMRITEIARIGSR
jgi:integrase